MGGKRKHPWIKRVFQGAGVLFLLLVLFHRPILIAIIRIAAIKVAARQHIRLNLEVGGTVLGSLSLENVHGRPDGTGPSPVEKVDIDLVRVNYDLISLARNGIQNFLRGYEVKNVNIIIKPVAGTPSQKEDLGSTLSSIFQIPALYTDHIAVENVSFMLDNPDGALSASGLTLTLDTDKPGVFQITELQIPHFRTWNSLSAVTSYTNRDLIISNLALDNDVVVDRVELDASRRLEKVNRIALESHVFGGTANLSLFLHELGNKKADAKIEGSVQGVSVSKLDTYLKQHSLPAATISNVSVNIEGDPYAPASLNGAVEVKLDDIALDTLRVDSVTARVVATQSVARVESARISIGTNVVALDARCVLPTSLDDPYTADLDGTFKVDAPEPARLSPQITQGRASVEGAFGMHNRLLTTQLSGTGSGLSVATASLSAFQMQASISKKMPLPKQQQTSALEGLRAQITAALEAVQVGEYAVDDVGLKVSSEDNHLRVENVTLKRKENAIAANATYDVPADNKWLEAPMHLDFTLTAPNLTAFNAEPALKGINGVINANGSLASVNGIYNGAIGVKGSKFAFNQFTADSLDIDVAVVNSVANVRALKLALNPVDQLAASANVDLRAPYHYSGALAFNIRDLAVFLPVLKASGVKDPVAGSLGITWQGSGDGQGARHTGNLQLKMQNGQYGEIKPIDIAVGGSYSPEIISFPTFHINTNRGNLQARIDLKDSLLQIRDVLFQQGTVGLVSGSLQIPLDLRNPKDVSSLLPSTGSVAVNLVSKDIKIEPLLKPLHGDAPAKGTVTTTITASGSLDHLAADVHVQARDLQAKAAAKLAPATFDMDLNLKDDRLALNGVLRQAKISPLEIKGSIPLPVKKLVQDKKIDEQSPVQLSVKLARTPAAFISDIVPAIRFAQGDVSLDVNVGGTLAKPAMSGSALLDIPAIRFLAQNLPAISGFKGNISFAGNRLTIARLGGDLSGGSFNLSGGIQIPSLTAPMQSIIDLSLTSKGALLLRNDTITARADADIRVTGTAEKAHVAGAVGITKSKFFREIDILPLQLPGRPAPKPPAPSVTTVSFPNPPLRDCTFDIAIKTKDPFLGTGKPRQWRGRHGLETGGYRALAFAGWHCADREFCRLASIQQTRDQHGLRLLQR